MVFVSNRLRKSGGEIFDNLCKFGYEMGIIGWLLWEGVMVGR